jgi:predicted nucleic acid-binding protein
MKITIDTNIVFSAILNSQGRIGHLIINGSKYFKFFSINLLKQEIFRHEDKHLKSSGMSDIQFRQAFQLITDRITFLDEILLADDAIQEALAIVSGIDENDALFVALTNHLESKLWTGDKKLANGLKNKGYNKVISTDELYEIFVDKKLSEISKKPEL